MTESEILERLHAVILQLGIELRECTGDCSGGLCRLNGKQVFLWNSALPAKRAVDLVCRELAMTDLSQVFLLPAIRERIEGRSEDGL